MSHNNNNKYLLTLEVCKSFYVTTYRMYYRRCKAVGWKGVRLI